MPDPEEVTSEPGSDGNIYKNEELNLDDNLKEFEIQY